MANKLYNEEAIREIAVAIREKNGTATTYNVSEMGQAIRNIPVGSGGITPNGTIEITTNGTHDVTQYASATVNVPTEAGGITPSGEITISENGRFDVTNFASAIVSITSSGSGDNGLPNNVKIGVLELEVDSTTAITVTHGCGVTPRAIALLPLTTVTKKGTTGGMVIDEVMVGHSNNSFSTAVVSISNVTETTFDFTPRSASYPLIGGHSYLWVAIT